MKRTLTLLIFAFVFAFTNAQQPIFVEYFTTRFNPDYDSIIKKCNSVNAIYVMSHINSQDTLTNSYGKQRMNDKKCYNVPTGYIHGHILPDNLDVDWNTLNTSFGGYITDISCLQSKITYENFTQPIITVTTNLSLSTLTNCTVSLFLIENYEKYKGVTKRYIRTQYFGQPIVIKLNWEKWNIDSTKFVVVVEDINMNVIGVREIGVKESLSTTGVNETITNETNVYPNPFIDQLNIISNNPIGLLILYNTLGEIIKYQTINNENYIINTSNLKNGAYFIKINDKVIKVIK
jgi:hypothetical protein